MTDYEDEATVSPGCDKCADMAYAGLLVHDENVDLHEQVDELVRIVKDQRESMVNVFKRAERAEAEVARLMRRLNGYPVDLRDEESVRKAVDDYTADL